jgi:hypothetical protein
MVVISPRESLIACRQMDDSKLDLSFRWHQMNEVKDASFKVQQREDRKCDTLRKGRKDRAQAQSIPATTSPGIICSWFFGFFGLTVFESCGHYVSSLLDTFTRSQ